MAVKITPQPRSTLPFDSVEWQRWFKSLQAYATGTGTITWSSIDFTGSNITSIAARSHSDLGGLQGGAALQYYHLTNVEYTGIGTGPFIRQTGLTTFSTITKTTTYTVLQANYTIRADATAGAFTVTLLDATTCKGQVFVIKKVDVTANLVTISTTSAQTIDGAASVSMVNPYAFTMVQSNGTNWDVI